MLDPRTPQSQRAYFPVARGVIDPEHRTKIGVAIWVFLWLIRHQTSNDGLVRRGDVVTAKLIATSLAMDEVSVRRHLKQLENEGYITVEACEGKGFKAWINKPLLVSKQSALFTAGPRSIPSTGEADTLDKSEQGRRGTLDKNEQGPGGDPRQNRAGTLDRNEQGIYRRKLHLEKESLEKGPTLSPSRANAKAALARERLGLFYSSPDDPARADRVEYLVGMTLSSMLVEHVDPHVLARAIHSRALEAASAKNPPDVRRFIESVRETIGENA